MGDFDAAITVAVTVVFVTETETDFTSSKETCENGKKIGFCSVQNLDTQYHYMN